MVVCNNIRSCSIENIMKMDINGFTLSISLVFLFYLTSAYYCYYGYSPMPGEGLPCLGIF